MYEFITTLLQSPLNESFINFMGRLQDHLCAMCACPHHVLLSLLQGPIIRAMRIVSTVIVKETIIIHHWLLYHLLGRLIPYGVFQ